MSWRDNLREVSFRGVPFFYDDTDGEMGRRAQRHEYAGQDVAYHEDLGLKTRVHTINAYVWGDNADVLAANLQAAIEAPGAGTLVHPVRGQMLAMVTNARVRTSTREGGLVTFALTFEETGSARQPQLSPLPVARIDAAADTSLSTVQKAFEEAFNVDGLPQFIATDAAGQVTTGVDRIKGAFADLRQSEQSAAGWVGRGADIKSRAVTIIRDPAQLAVEIADVIGVDLELPGARLARSLSRLFDFGRDVPAVAATTATRRIQVANRDAFTAVVRQTAVIHAARASGREQFPNRASALVRRDQIADVIETETLTAPDASYRELVALRAEVIRAIDVQAARLPRLKTIRPARTRPVLALAHDLYGDDPSQALALSSDLVARNRVRHPGFVPGGDDLEVTIGGVSNG